MKVTITITTTDEQFGWETSEHDVSGYLLESGGLEEIAGILSKVKILENTANKDLNYIFVNNNSGSEKLNLNDILYIMANGDYVQIRTSRKKVVVHSSLKRMQKKLPATTFLKVHRSYIVNINKIVHVKTDSIQIAEDIIPIGRTHKEIVRNKLNRR